MTGRAGALLVALLVTGGPLLALATTNAAAIPAYAGMTVTGDVSFVGASFILTDHVVIRAGGRLTIDNTTVLVRMADSFVRGFYVEAGGELAVTNNSRITSAYESSAYTVHFAVFVEPGARFTLRDSTIEGASAMGVGDEGAVIENSTIANALLGLYGWNLTVRNTRFLGNTVGFWVSGNSRLYGIEARNNLQYAGMLEDQSRVEGGAFADSSVADLAMFSGSSAFNTTHLRSPKGIIVNGDTVLQNVSIVGTSYAGIQLGDIDLGYGCGSVDALPPRALAEPPLLPLPVPHQQHAAAQRLLH